MSREIVRDQLERSIIGGCIFSNEVLPKVYSIVSEDMFKSKARHAWRAIAALFVAHQPVDLVTVTQALSASPEASAAVAPHEVIEWVSEVNMTATQRTISGWASSLARSHQCDLIVKKAQEIQRAAESQDQDRITELASDLLTASAYAAGDDKNTLRSMTDMARMYQQEIEERRQLGDNAIPTGIAALDRRLKMRPGGLHVIGGRPGMGKTAYALNVARMTARSGCHVAFFSLEMDETELTGRLISSLTGIPLTTLLSAQGDQHQETMAMCKLSEMTMTVDCAAQSIYTIIAKCRVLAARGLDAVVIDYLQLGVPPGTSKNRTRENEISAASRACKLMAKELRVPVILLSQLSRGAEHRENRRPVMSDLRESGAIEQDADTITFLYRPGYYDKHADADLLEVIVAKQRNGWTGVVEASFRLTDGRFA